MKVALTDRKLRSLKPAPVGERYFIMDTVERQFGVRVDDERNIIFYLNGFRLPGSSVPLKRAIGDYPAMSLAEGRAEAKAYKAQIARGADPKQAKRQESPGRGQTPSFVDRLATQRRGKDVERVLRRHLADWMDRPAASITTREVRDLIKARKAAKYEAHNVFGAMSQLFGYAVDEDAYGVEVNPTAGLKPSKLIGEKIARDHPH
jgi:Arm DNA-binding domain